MFYSNKECILYLKIHTFCHHGSAVSWVVLLYRLMVLAFGRVTLLSVHLVALPHTRHSNLFQKLGSHLKCHFPCSVRTATIHNVQLPHCIAVIIRVHVYTSTVNEFGSSTKGKTFIGSLCICVLGSTTRGGCTSTP